MRNDGDGNSRREKIDISKQVSINMAVPRLLSKTGQLLACRYSKLFCLAQSSEFITVQTFLDSCKPIIGKISNETSFSLQSDCLHYNGCQTETGCN